MVEAIKKLLKESSGYEAYEIEAPETATYPYIVFEARRLNSNDHIENYTLEVNVWDLYHTYSRVKKAIKDIENAIDYDYEIGNDYGMFSIYKGTSQTVPDENKKIKRVREQFDMMVIERR